MQHHRRKTSFSKQHIRKPRDANHLARTFYHGYLAKYPTRCELMKDWLQEQACAAAVATKKNSELQDEVQDLKERLANDVAKREYDKEESRWLMEQQLVATRNEMRKEFLAMLAQQKETTPQQVILYTYIKMTYYKSFSIILLTCKVSTSSINCQLSHHPLITKSLLHHAT
jgi:hypothetical protein